MDGAKGGSEPKTNTQNSANIVLMGSTIPSSNASSISGNSAEGNLKEFCIMSGKYVGLSQYGPLPTQNDVVLAPEKLGTFLGSGYIGFSI